jgi:hypothetical protein
MRERKRWQRERESRGDKEVQKFRERNKEREKRRPSNTNKGRAVG